MKGRKTLAADIAICKVMADFVPMPHQIVFRDLDAPTWSNLSEDERRALKNVVVTLETIQAASAELVADRIGNKHDPAEIADMLDGFGDRASEAIGDDLHVAADIVRALTYRVRLLSPTDNERCRLCSGLTILPNFMDAPGGPRCACGRPSVHEYGGCEIEHGAVPCPRCSKETR